MFNSWQKTDINKTLDVSNFYDSFKIRHHQSTQKKSIFKNASLREKCLYLPLFWSECEKTWTRITPNTDAFYAVRFLHCMELILTSYFQSSITRKTFDIRQFVTCKSSWLIYLMKCCLGINSQYIGKWT